MGCWGDGGIMGEGNWGMLGDIGGRDGEIWGDMGRYGEIWGGGWRMMEDDGGIWRIMEGGGSGMVWRCLE